MAIFDIFEEVSEKSVMKTDTGDQRIFGFVVGEVVDNYSDEYPGRVCIKVYTRDDPEKGNILQWARVVQTYAGSAWGFYFLPEVGDQVLVGFEEGLIDRPYVIGCLNKTADRFQKKSVHERNQHKRIVTRQGSTIEFEDMPDDKNQGSGDGTKDKIKIYTPDMAHSVVMDNEKKLIEIKDKDSNAVVTMKTEKGQITVQAAEKIIFKAGDNITVAMNGANSADKITVNCKDLVVNATGKISMEATRQFIAKGASGEISSTGKLSLSANGLTEVKGTPVKLG